MNFNIAKSLMLIIIIIIIFGIFYSFYLGVLRDGNPFQDYKFLNKG